MPENRVMAETHLRQAALTGYAPAMLRLARLHGDGFEAALWYRAAADIGDAEAQFAIGALHARGEGVPQRLDIAAAGSSGRPSRDTRAAQFNLGIFRLNGTGVERDPAQAADWLARAAEQGMARAQTRLAQLYFTGEGIAQDDARRRNGCSAAPRRAMPRPKRCWPGCT